MTTERLEVQRHIAAPPEAVLAVLTDPQGHVRIDSSGMLQSAAGEPVGTVQPPIKHLYGYRLEPSGTGTLATSYYDWTQIERRYPDADPFPVIPEGARKATLGILARP